MNILNIYDIYGHIDMWIFGNHLLFLLLILLIYIIHIILMQPLIWPCILSPIVMHNQECAKFTMKYTLLLLN